VGLRILLVIAILGVLGIETTSFAALLAAAGIAIGAAWAGLLANFAAGVFLIVLRPFKVGEAILAGGVTGVVREIGLFVTTLDTGDNVRVYVGNNKLFSDNIVNYSSNAYRRVDLVAQVPTASSPRRLSLLKEKVARIPNVIQNPRAAWRSWIQCLRHGHRRRPYCNNNDYCRCISDTNKAIMEVGARRLAVPEQRVAVRNVG
jgi:small conductance mechanosensitive channel